MVKTITLIRGIFAALLLTVSFATVSYAVPNPPVISPFFQCFSASPQQITITGDAGTTLWMTLDGSDPVAGGGGSTQQYTAPFNISSTKTIKALAYDGVSSSSITTTVVQIDTATANVPSSGRILWLKSDLGVIHSNFRVQTWHDASGSGNTASQSTGSSQPVLVPNAVSETLGAVSFDGAQFLQIPPGFSNLGSGGVSCFLVTKILEPTASNGAFFDFGNAGSDDVALTEGADANAPILFYMFNGASPSFISTGNGGSVNAQYQLFEAWNSAGTGKTWWNGELRANQGQGGTNAVTRNNNYIGKLYNNTYFKGQIVELLVYSRAVSDTERQDIEKYLQLKFGPTISPPSAVLSSGTGGTQSVTIRAVPGTTVKYTLDSSSPVTSPTARTYTGSFTVNNSTVVRAYATQALGNSPISNSFLCFDGSGIAIPRNGLNLWLRGDFAAVSSNNKVSLWGDLSSQTNDAVQTVANNQPDIAMDADVGKQVLSFNGTTQSMQVAQSFTSNLSSGASIFVLTKPNSISAGQRFLDFGNGQASDNLYLAESAPAGASLFAYAGSTPSSVTSTNALTAGQYQLLEAIHNGAGSASILTNGVLGNSGSVHNLANIVRTGNFIGRDFNGGNLLSGNIAELLAWNRPLTSSERAAVESYFLSKYQVLSQVPPNPVLNLAGGTLAQPTQVVISAKEGTTTYFTTDGSTPSPATSPLYDGTPIPISYSLTVKAMSVSKNGIQSGVTTASYALDSTRWPAPSSDTSPLNVNLQLPTTASPQ